MRALITAVCLTFAVGGLVVLPMSASACEEYGASYSKKNDFETPPPAASTPAKPAKSG